MSLWLVWRCELTILFLLLIFCPGDRPQGDQQAGKNQTGRCHFLRTLPVLVSVFSVTPLHLWDPSTNLWIFYGGGVLFSSLLSPQDVMAPLFPQPLIQSSNELGASLWPWMMSPPTMRFRTWIGRMERSPRRHVRYRLLRRCFFSKHLTAGSNKKSGKHVKQQLRAGPLCCLHPLSGRFKKFTGAGIPVSQAERKSLQVKNNPATKEVKAVDGERLHLNSVRSRNGSRVHLN